MPAQIGASGSSDSARFLIPAQNPAIRIDEEDNQLQEDADMEEIDNDENILFFSTMQVN